MKHQFWAIIIFFLTLACAAVFFFGGLVIGTMATDGCRVLPHWAGWYLFGLWPLSLLLAAFVPAILIFRGARLGKILWCYFIFGGLTILCLLGWFINVAILCGDDIGLI